MYPADHNPPTDLKVRRMTKNSTLLVSWTPPSGSIQPSGYIIYYEATGLEASDKGTINITTAGTSQQSIMVKYNEADVHEYIVKIVALYVQLPSVVVAAVTKLGEPSRIIMFNTGHNITFLITDKVYRCLEIFSLVNGLPIITRKHSFKYFDWPNN